VAVLSGSAGAVSCLLTDRKIDDKKMESLSTDVPVIHLPVINPARPACSILFAARERKG
jgi:hypothetical protein